MTIEEFEKKIHDLQCDDFEVKIESNYLEKDVEVNINGHTILNSVSDNYNDAFRAIIKQLEGLTNDL